jgi:hypothetical protein
VCAGFCAQCRVYFADDELVHWWRTLPFHPTCGPRIAPDDRVANMWGPGSRCLVSLCGQVKAYQDRCNGDDGATS